MHGLVKVGLDLEVVCRLGGRFDRGSDEARQLLTGLSLLELDTCEADRVVGDLASGGGVLIAGEGAMAHIAASGRSKE